MKKANAHKAPSPNVNLYRGVTKILTHLPSPADISLTMTGIWRNPIDSQTFQCLFTVQVHFPVNVSGKLAKLSNSLPVSYTKLPSSSGD